MSNQENNIFDEAEKMLQYIKKVASTYEDLSIGQIKIINSLLVSSYFNNNLVFSVASKEDREKVSQAVDYFFEPVIKFYLKKDVSVFFKVVENKPLVIEKPIKINNKSVENDFVSKNAESSLDPQFSLENFVVSSSNRIVFGACSQISENPGAPSQNPCYIWGAPGLGKTHLLNAVGNHILKFFPDKKVLYCTSKTFVEDYVEAVGKKGEFLQSFNKKYKNLDVLLIDDIQFLSEKEATSKEFFHLFNDLIQKQKQIVVSADVEPNKLSGFHKRLVSRFEGSSYWEISAPDYEMRVAFLKKYIRKKLLVNNNIFFSNKHIEIIANALHSNVRQLESAIDKIVFQCEINQQDVSEDIINKTLFLSLNNKKENVSLEKILENVADYFSINILDIKGKSRTPNLSRARHITMYLARKMTDLTSVQIGSFFNKEHSSVLNAEKQIKKQINENKQIKKQINEIIKKINTNL